MRERSTGARHWRVVLGPIGRILLATVLVGGSLAVAQLVVKLLQSVLSLGGAVPAFYYLAYLIVSVLVAYFVYRAHVRLVEKRAVDELSGSGAPVDLGLGAPIGLLLVAVTVIFLWAFGSYAVLGVNSLAVIFVSLANDGAGAFVEKVILRGIVFRITEERTGTWVALAISVVLFALLHLASPGATVIGAIVVGAEGGIPPSAAYVLTRRLWLPIGAYTSGGTSPRTPSSA